MIKGRSDELMFKAEIRPTQTDKAGTRNHRLIASERCIHCIVPRLDIIQFHRHFVWSAAKLKTKAILHHLGSLATQGCGRTKEDESYMEGKGLIEV